MIEISVIIPTHNRVESLQRTLTSIRDQRLDKSKWEVIVIANHCSDTTLQMATSFRDSNPEIHVCVIEEPRLGLHFARHAGVAVAKGSLLVFTDDDATFDKGWLEAYLVTFRENDKMLAAGGPIKAQWEETPAQWVLNYIGEGPFFGILSLMDLGESFELTPRGVFFGVNMAIRKSVLIRCGGFHPEAYGDVWLGDGETGVMLQLWQEGHPIGYIPQAKVFHHIPAHRMTIKYFKLRMANQGRCDIYSKYHPIIPGKLKILRDLYALLIKLVRSIISGLVIDNDLSPKAIDQKLNVAKIIAEAAFTFKLLINEELRNLVSKTDWLEETEIAQTKKIK